MPQAAQALVRLNAPLPPPPVAYPACRTSSGHSTNSNSSTCLKVLFLTRSNKPAVRQASKPGCSGGSSEGREAACLGVPLASTGGGHCAW